MSQTPAQVRDRIGNELGILSLGQSLKPQDDTRITQAYNEVYAALKRDGYAIWASTASMPDEFVPHFAALGARNCLGVFSVSDSRYKRIMHDAENAEREIPKLAVPSYVSVESSEGF